MADDRPEDTGSLPDSDRPKRPPPTIDLEATEISSELHGAGSDAPSETGTQTTSPPPDARPISSWVVAPVSGAVAAALVIGVGWLLGWPPVQPAGPQPDAAAVDGLTARVAGLESRTSKPAPPDSATAARIDALEKSLTAVRGQSEKLAAAVNEIRSMPRDGTAPRDLSAFNERIATIESTMRAHTAEIAQQAGKLADARAADAKPADDTLLRRVVAAALLDVYVRHGDPFAAQLSAAKSLADTDALKPLDGFAASGVPGINALCRELVEIVPKLAPPAPESSTVGAGIVDRLQAGAAKLVRVQRTDAAGSDRGSVVARVTTAALRNELAEARHELKALPPADRAPAQAWLDKTDVRDAALAASRKFAGDATAAFAQGK